MAGPGGDRCPGSVTGGAGLGLGVDRDRAVAPDCVRDSTRKLAAIPVVGAPSFSRRDDGPPKETNG